MFNILVNILVNVVVTLIFNLKKKLVLLTAFGLIFLNSIGLNHVRNFSPQNKLGQENIDKNLRLEVIFHLISLYF